MQKENLKLYLSGEVSQEVGLVQPGAVLAFHPKGPLLPVDVPDSFDEGDQKVADLK